MGLRICKESPMPPAPGIKPPSGKYYNSKSRRWQLRRRRYSRAEHLTGRDQGHNTAEDGGWLLVGQECEYTSSPDAASSDDCNTRTAEGEEHRKLPVEGHASRLPEPRVTLPEIDEDSGDEEELCLQTGALEEIGKCKSQTVKSMS